MRITLFQKTHGRYIQIDKNTKNNKYKDTIKTDYSKIVPMDFEIIELFDEDEDFADDIKSDSLDKETRVGMLMGYVILKGTNIHESYYVFDAESTCMEEFWKILINENNSNLLDSNGLVQNDLFFISKFWMTKKNRKKGIGTAVLNNLFEMLKTEHLLNINTLVLNASPMESKIENFYSDYIKLKKYYESNGFKEIDSKLSQSFMMKSK